MIGLGCGARSYTRQLHYADRYAVKPNAVAAIVDEYASRSDAGFRVADYGYELNAEDQRRRYAIISLLQAQGVSRDDYQRMFGGDILLELPEFAELASATLADISDGHIVLTPAGLERSDAIGPWLYSDRVRRRMDQYQWH